MATRQPSGHKRSLLYHRVQLASTTLRWARERARACGVTRCGGVTGLDRVGIPVYQAVRPNARSVAVSAGKGTDSAAAKTSALMEAIELHHAETVSPTERFRFCDVRDGPRVLDPGDFALPPFTEIVRQMPLDWMNGFDLAALERPEFPTNSPGADLHEEAAARGLHLLVPYDIVHCRFDVQTLSATPAGLFRTSTNGLASGFTREEALCHALCEVIERHCVIEWMRLSQNRLSDTKITLDSIDDENVRRLLRRVSSRELDIAIWDISGPIGLPAFRCALCDRDRDGFYSPIPSLGAGCHPSRSYAMIRAILEAAQTRLTLVAGARADVSHSLYHAGAEPELWTSQRREIVQTRARVDAGALPDFRNEYVSQDLDCLLGHLRRAGFDRSVAVDLTAAEIGAPVVRVVVPGLKAPTPYLRSEHRATWPNLDASHAS